MSLLETFDLDVLEVLEDLRLNWEDNTSYTYNPNAFSRIKDNGENIMFCCPEHSETNPSAGITTSAPYKWNCFGCGATGTIGTLVAIALGMPKGASADFYITKNYLVVERMERKAIDLNSILDGTDDKKFHVHSEEDIAEFKRFRHKYFETRGFSERTLRVYEAGYDKESQCITLPIRTSKGEIRFVKRRSVRSKMFLNEKNVAKRDIVYGLYYILNSGVVPRTLFLNESETDTLSCYEGGLLAGSILGRLLFKEQVHELLLAGVKEVNLFFDNDKYGYDATLQAYELLKETPIIVNVVLYPGGHWGIDHMEESMYKDANELLKAKKLKEIKIIPYIKFIQLVKTKNMV